MPPVLLPSTLLPSNICRFAVNNAKFASLEIFTLSNPRKVEETDLSVSLSFSFVIQRRGSRVITSHLLKGLLFHLFTSHAPLEGLSWYFLVIAASPRNLAKLPPIPFSWNFSIARWGWNIGSRAGLFPRWLLWRIIVARSMDETWIESMFVICYLLYCCYLSPPSSGDKLSRIVRRNGVRSNWFN